MYDLSYLKSNDKLIIQCQKLIDDHNKISYKKVEVVIPLITFDLVNLKRFKPKDPISLEIVNMFAKYVSQMIFLDRLDRIIESIQYTNEDLTIHFDRSTETVLQIFSSLASIRNQLISQYEQMLNNSKLEINAFISFITKLITQSTNFNEVIQIIYTSMSLNGIEGEYKPFLPIGIQLIDLLYKSNLLSTNQIFLIRSLNDELKKSILGGNNLLYSNVKVNKLQIFGLLPDEGQNVSLPVAIDKLFGLSIKAVPSLKDAIQPLSKTLKLVSMDTGIKTGIIVFISPNDDTYFDMSSILQTSKSIGSSGINIDMIQTMELLRQHPIEKSIKEYDILPIGISEESIDRAYMLWTNDLKTFKIRSVPIDAHMVKKILRTAPSPIIESYNSTFQETIVNRPLNDVASFKKVQYMSFSNDVTEESFLKKFKDRLVASVMSIVGKLDGVKLHTAVVSDKFGDAILDTLDSTKIDFGIHPHLMSSHCHIMYASMSNKILQKLKKELLQQESINKSIVASLIQGIVESNDNIYSRTIASYFLQIS